MCAKTLNDGDHIRLISLRLVSGSQYAESFISIPCERAQGVGHLARTSQNIGMANLPEVLFSSVTAMRSFQGLSATASVACKFL